MKASILHSIVPLSTFLLGIVVCISGCKDLTGSSALPAGTPNPSIYNNTTGAIGMRNAAVYQFELAVNQYILDAGLITDELVDNKINAGTATVFPSTAVTDPLDERILQEGGSIPVNSYDNLQKARGFIDQAVGALATYDTSAKVLRGELYAFEGYVELMLADLFCSGVPLSTIDFQKDYTYASGSTTVQLYHAALAKFDTALTFAGTSDSVLFLARLGKGRAYLSLGLYTAAADDVTTIPDGFRYNIAIPRDFSCGTSTGDYTFDCRATVSDREGINGLPYRSSGDPRTATVFTRIFSDQGFPSGDSLFFPAKYTVALSLPGYSPFTLASGVEGRLIQAEVALQANDPSWLTILNSLRTDGSVASTYTRSCHNGISDIGQAGSPCPAGVIDTTWGPGTGIGLIPASVLADAGPDCPTSSDPGTACGDTVWYKGLHPLTDPGTASARIALLFQERAYWLFATGERQGDLRRLIRQYSKRQEQIYPTGLYLAPGTGVYGTDVTAPIPPSEYSNPIFHGCKDRLP